MGRTEMQDAVPMTVGQEFHAFAASLEGEIQFLKTGGEVSVHRQHGGNRHRHRHQRTQGLPGKVRSPAGQADRQADRSRDRHAGGDVGPAGIRGLFLCAEEHGDQALEDRERSHPARLGSARGTFRDQPARAAAGFLHHAGQGESGDARGDEPRRLSRDRQRLRVTLAGTHGQLQLNAYEPVEGLAIMESQSLLLHADRSRSAPSASTASR